ncbi:MAG: dCMP deaminase family protein [Acholeplasmatales bacterium]|nr:dCMP deaminase family protein [Acholeplasmatales bacterium]
MHISWDEYFMGVALLSAKRSKDPNTQVGACIVREDKRIVGIGYNGFPTGCSDDVFPWGKGNKNDLLNKYPFVVHAEANCILNASSSVKGATLYVTLFPCNECAKLIIQSGIKHLVYMCDKYRDETSSVASRMMLDAAGIDYRQMDEIEVTINAKK